MQLSAQIQDGLDHKGWHCPIGAQVRDDYHHLAIKLSARGVVNNGGSSMHLDWCSCLHRAKMVKIIRGWPMWWLQAVGTTKPENRISILSSEELKDVKDSKVIVDYEPEESDQNNEPVVQQEGGFWCWAYKHGTSPCKDILTENDASSHTWSDPVCTGSTNAWDNGFIEMYLWLEISPKAAQLLVR